MIEISLDDLDFCICLFSNFPFAANHETETMLSDFLAEHYPSPSDEYLEEFCGTESERGMRLLVRINEDVCFIAEFHHSETVYFFNHTYIGNSGGHFRLSLLSWQEFQQMVNQVEYPHALFFLLLPLVVGKKSEASAIKTAITAQLLKLPFQENHKEIIADYLTNHCVSDSKQDPFFATKELGVLCRRNHSERNALNNKESILEVNRLIELATGSARF